MHVPQTDSSLPACIRAILLIALIFILTSHPARAARQAVAIVIAERGNVQYQRSGTTIFQRLGSQVELSVGDTVQTGPQAEAELLFRDGSHVKLNSNTRLRITLSQSGANTKNLFQALVGVIWAHLRPGQQVQTPTANIVVRGTEIALAVQDDGTTMLTVVEGDASFFNTFGTVEVGESQQSIVRPGHAPTPPVAVDSSGLITWTADIAGLPLEFETPSLMDTVSSSEDLGTAADALESQAEAAPTDITVWLRLGQARRRQGDLPHALDAYSRAAQISPNNPDASIGMALTYLSQGKTDQARAVLEPVKDQALPLAVIGLVDLHEGDGQKAQKDLEASLVRDPTLAVSHSLLSLADLTENDLSSAEKAAREAVRLDPTSAQAQGTLAMTLFFAGNDDAALAAARRAVRLNPRSPFALLAQARAFLAKDQTEAARTSYEKADAFAPSLWIVHQELGMVYLRLDMPQKAAEECKIALRHNPDSVDAHSNLGLALQRQGNPTEAEAEFRRAIALQPGNATAHGDLGALFVERGQLTAAREELETGVKSAPERGILYARLAEISLYRQDLFTAQKFARRAVELLPESAVAHYTLGRVYLEQERTVQAEQEFRQATTLDRKFAEARYALGLTEEKTEGGLLNSFNSLLGSALVGSPGTTLSLQNLLTPGAEQRIQAASLDPTAVRVASRSYGDTQLDAQFGERNTRDLAGSYLTETEDRRGVRGMTVEEQATDGVRAQSGLKDDTASVIFGQKAADNPLGLFVTGDYEDNSKGADTGITSDPFAANQRYHTQLSRILGGVNTPTGDFGRLRALLQFSKSVYRNNDVMSADQNHFDIRSVNGEVRWDGDLGAANHLSAGGSLGSRRRQVNSNLVLPDPTAPIITDLVDLKLQPYQVYIRDETRLNTRWTLTAEMQLQRLDRFNKEIVLGFSGIPPVQESSHKTFGLPSVIVSYQADSRSAFRIRARRLFGTVDDFQLLAPTDVFIVSFAGLPEANTIGTVPSSDGTSVEMEYDRTFADASFLRVGAYQQDIRQAGFLGGDIYDKAHNRGLQASFEGLLSRDLSFYLSGDFNYARDSETGLRIAQIPDFAGLASLQYLNRDGYYAQTAYYYQGNRVAASDDRSHLGVFGVLNLRFGKRSGLRTNLYIELNNILNKKYDVYGALQLPRQVGIGISQRF